MKIEYAFALFSLIFALLAFFVPLNDVQQGQSVGFAFLFGGMSLAMFEGQRIANKRQNRK
jgi:hypothetical protein